MRRAAARIPGEPAADTRGPEGPGAPAAGTPAAPGGAEGVHARDDPAAGPGEDGRDPAGVAVRPEQAADNRIPVDSPVRKGRAAEAGTPGTEEFPAGVPLTPTAGSGPAAPRAAAPAAGSGAGPAAEERPRSAAVERSADAPVVEVVVEGTVRCLSRCLPVNPSVRYAKKGRTFVEFGA
ncbi:hypothetical protein GCM10017600_21250 [Streptosporangium carneum]|uniref:Uncharacterized protein n=1 Tax=Streptosporangium carneum TaxID=47481 RepID=A0A9W6I0H7_9ACTN|nr:hypothetical protein GCM10017600_21250 [Streptosporangium carneum]